MSQPLGKFVGNAVEVYECIKILRGEADKQMQPTLYLSAELTAKLLVQCKVADSIQNAKLKIQRVLRSGDALSRFQQNIELQGGDPKVCDKPELLLIKGIRQVPVAARSSGYLSAIDALCIGHLIGEIGGGRVRAEDKVDHAVGYAALKKLGDRVRKGDDIGVIYCRDRKQAATIGERLQNAYKITGEIPKKTKLIRAAV
jgi:thymidine phosphorylase